MIARLATMSNETRAGILLALAALAGVLSENIGALKPTYDLILTTYITLSVGGAAISKPILLWINDALMAVFFFLVALEIKKEIAEGSLSEWRKAALPVYGAIGGMAVPALVFIGIVGIDSAEAVGWAIPAATDIAFALGVLSLFGNRVPPALKAFLLALAVVDDLAAIVIIALFYTSSLSIEALALGAIGLAVLAGMNVGGVKRKAPFILVGIFLWVCVLKSGVHATLAGVALGFAIPIGKDHEGRSPLKTLEHGLHPYVAYFVMPIFAFANAGVPLGGLTFADLTAPLTLAIALGLFVGKQVGVFGCAWGAIRLGLAEPPKGATLMQLYAVALIAGIGFTMSLFIGTLAFSDPEHQNAVRLGVLAGSLLSGLTGSIVLARATSNGAAQAGIGQRVPAE
ncbi:Na+/H+ antiporter NhaA [Limibaculum sp. FT325]|uniref:Na+/H+ antiporter NhaA n=1 Tax=Thermohalobaculum sediminis TaxID=2939436 RepID=UPI0020C102CF|nr:Na+/H+ antiporter NhaA [Limibaculum sediminis]MCL5778320.1 Na+/H+ antiporter NhaA [Limibaculum sediminis]